MSSSPSRPITTASVLLQKANDTVAHGTTELATKADIDELNTSIDELNTSIDELNTSIDELKTSIDELQASIDEIKESVDEIKESVDEIKTGQQRTESLLAQILQGQVATQAHIHEDVSTSAATAAFKDDAASDVTEQTQTHSFIPPQEVVAEAQEEPVAVESKEQDAPPSLWYTSTASVVEVPVQSPDESSAPSAAVPSSTLAGHFPILNAATSALDLETLYESLRFPHDPFPISIEEHVDAERCTDLDRLFEGVSSSLLKSGIIGGLTFHQEDPDRISYHRLFSRSLSIAVEYVVAVSAQTDPQASIEIAIEELCPANDSVVWAHNPSLQDWLSEVAKKYDEKVASRRQEIENLGDVRFQTAADLMEDVQATPTQTQLPPSPNQPNTSQSQSITNAHTQPCPNSQFVQHPEWVPLAPGPTKDATTAPTMIHTDGDKLSTGKMNKFRPFPQQSLRLSCITDDVRSNTVARFYRLLKSKNPPRTASGCHLSDNQMLEAACGAEIQILVLMEEDIREKNLVAFSIKHNSKVSSSAKNDVAGVQRWRKLLGPDLRA